MPELPEIETYKTYFDNTSLHLQITHIDLADERLLKKDISEFREQIIGTEFTGTTRIGKYLFVHTSGKKVLVLHFGMTGNLDYYKDQEDRPKFAHIVYSFNSGFHLGFLNRRKFGWNDLANSVEEYKAQVGLSDDARDLTLSQFKETLHGKSTFLKSALLDQSVAAGVGNWMADEILYQARIHPQRRVSELNEGKIEEIYQVMIAMIETAIEKEAVHRNFPDEYFIHIRKKGSVCHHTGAEIEKMTIGGRSTYFSPEWQVE